MSIASHTATKRFLIVEDHPLFSEAVATALKARLGASEVICVETLAAGLAHLERGAAFDAVLLDLNLPDVSGFDGLARVKAARPSLPVVVISGHSDDRSVSLALRAGASGFVPKEAAKEDLVSALATVLAGGCYTPPGYCAAPSEASGAEVVGRLTELTPQQHRILEQMCEGKLNKQIAFELSIAETTVKAHVTAILRKLKVHSRTQAVLMAKEARFSDGLNAT